MATINGEPAEILSKFGLYVYGPGGGRIEFQTFPQGIQESKSPQWTPNSILGRSHDIQGYSSSSPRQLSFTTKYIRTDELAGNKVWTSHEIITHYKLWMSLTYPNYTGEKVLPPARVKVLLGTIRMLSIPQDISIAVDDEAGWHMAPTGPMPNSFGVSATFIEIWPTPLSANQIRLLGWW